MQLLSRILVSSIMLLGLPVGEAIAGAAYQYRAPDGNLVFTDKPMEAPYKLVNAMYLDWGDVKGRAPDPVKLEDDEPAKKEKRVKVDKLFAEDVTEGSKADKFSEIVTAKAEKYRLAPELIHAVIEAESAYNPVAVSHAGAVGLMQLMPKTAERLGVNDSTDPAQNIEGGAKYLRQLLNLFDNDLRLALAGYNAGEGAVMKYDNSVPPYKETQNYVKIVLRKLRRNIMQNTERKSKNTQAAEISTSKEKSI